MHVHGTVQPNGHGQLSVRLLSLVCPGVQSAEAEVAVRLERTHAEFLGQGEGLAVVGCSGLDLWGLPACVELAEKPQGVGFVAPLLMGSGEVKGVLRLGVRLVQTAS